MKGIVYYPVWPIKEQDWCEYWKKLDRDYETDERSPLHHDNRCRLCGFEKGL